jgi:hypothetical protein
MGTIPFSMRGYELAICPDPESVIKGTAACCGILYLGYEMVANRMKMGSKVCVAIGEVMVDTYCIHICI